MCFFLPLGIAYVRETTVFREYGPLSGHTLRVGYEYAPKMSVPGVLVAVNRSMSV